MQCVTIIVSRVTKQPTKTSENIMLELKLKWEKLINTETGANAKVNLVGEDKIQVLVSGDKAFDVYNFFFGKDIEILDNGFLVAL